MILLVRLDTDPTMSFYRDARANSFASGVAYRRLVIVGAIRRPLQVGGGSENANCSVTLDNGDGQLTSLFASPPFRRRAVIEDVSTGTAARLFTGTVTRATLGPEITLELEA
jgi:hypothetical protein